MDNPSQDRVEELKPCPFCGQPGELVDTLPGGTYWVRCSSCDGEGPCSNDKTAADAIAAWNTRLESEAVTVMREALIRTATALNSLIECVGFPVSARTHYRWSKLATFDEVQEAMEANNNAAAVLAKLSHGSVGYEK